jgi:hypothetical protein
MPNTHNKALNDHIAARETVILLFNKRDSQIARNWSKSNKTKDMFDDKC